MIDIIKRTIKHSGVYALGNLAQKALGFLLLPVYTRYLSTADYGLLELVSVCLSIIVLMLIMGIPGALIKIYTHDCSNKSEKKSLVFMIIILLLGVNIPALCILFRYTAKIALLVTGDEKYAILFKIILVTIFCNIFITIVTTIYRAEEQSKRFVIISTIHFLISLVLNIYFVVIVKMQVKGILLGNMISSVITLCILLPELISKIKIAFSKKYLTKLLKISLPLIPSSLAMWIMNASDRYFLRIYSTMHELGLYSLGAKLSMVVYLSIVIPFNLAWPTIMFSITKRKDAKNIYSNILKYFVFISMFFSLILCLTSKEILMMMSTRPFWESYKVVPFLVCSHVLYGMQNIFLMPLYLKEKMFTYPFILSISAAINLLLNYWLIPKYGFIGASFATLLSFLALSALVYYISQKEYYIPYELDKIFKISFSFVIVLSLNSVMNKLSIILYIFKKIILFISFFILLYLSNFFSKKEIIKMKEVGKLGYLKILNWSN